jgi:cystine transport system substrate-binding protein
MKKFIVTAVAAALTAGLAGCSSSAASASSASASSSVAGEDHLARIKAAGTLNVGLEGDWQPFSFHEDETDATSKLMGYDVEVSAEIAKRLGVEVNYTEAAFDGLLAGVSNAQNGQFDIVANGVDITPEREETFYFSDPYAYDHTVLVTSDTNTDVTSFEDMNGKKAANSDGSSYQALDEQYGATVLAQDTLAQCMELVKNGTADVTTNAQTSVQDYFNTVGQDGLKVAAVMDDEISYGIIMAKDPDNDTLLKAVNDALADMKEDGTLAELSEKYFGADLTVSSAK